jgi:hypothetical protein
LTVCILCIYRTIWGRRSKRFSVTPSVPLKTFPFKTSSLHILRLNQSINQRTNQPSAAQSTNQPTRQQISQLINLMINQSATTSFNQSIN